MANDLPVFTPDQWQKGWIQDERRTADFIKKLWNAASRKQRREYRFVWLLIQLGWMTTSPNGKPNITTIRWRNKKISEYLTGSEKFRSESELQKQLREFFPQLKLPPNFLRDQYTGITHCYSTHRKAAHTHAQGKLKQVVAAFEAITQRNSSPECKIKTVIEILEKLGTVTIKGKRKKILSPLNGLTPVIACLDPDKRFPIINGKTSFLLKASNATSNADGAIVISGLIGTRNIRDSFELDVYAGSHFNQIKKTAKQRRKSIKRISRLINLKEKSTAAVYAKIADPERKIARAHNELTNAFLKAIEWKWEIKESVCDAFIYEWKKGRHLLIEAKTKSSGTEGRVQVRQAIGQLFDYRLGLGREHKISIDKIDLAILLPQEPKEDIYDLLESIDPQIGILWFDKKKLKGTQKLKGFWNYNSP